MWQELLRIHVPYTSIQVPIYGYGLMLVVGFLAATALGRFLARRVGLDGEVFVNAALLALVTGVLGARISHVLENFSEYTRADRSSWDNFLDAANLRSGGLTFYGGFILATGCLLLYGRLKRVPLKLGMDIVAPCVMIGLAFGRIGCFLNGCCYGAECDSVPWQVRFPYMSIPYQAELKENKLTVPAQLQTKAEIGKPQADVPALGLLSPKPASRPMTPEEAQTAGVADAAAHEHSLWLHPAQIYSSIDAFLIAAVLIAFFTLRPPPGRVFALMLLLDPPTRFLLEMLRVEEPLVWGLTMAQVTAIPLFVVGIWLWRHPSRKPVPVLATVHA